MYEVCEAPLCPLESNSLTIWYAEEEICRDREHRNLPWVQAQRKIAKFAPAGYFTMEMLNRNCIIKTGMLGLNPDREERPQLQLWLKNHPAKQEISDEDREKRTEHLKKHRFTEKTRSAKKGGSESFSKSGFMAQK
jgi:hypothetical protein